MEQYLNISDIANYYKVSTKTVRNWMKKGMPHLRIGSVIRFNVTEVGEWIHNREGE